MRQRRCPTFQVAVALTSIYEYATLQGFLVNNRIIEEEPCVLVELLVTPI